MIDELEANTMIWRSSKCPVVPTFWALNEYRAYFIR
jgi:hypothetical protein